MLLEKTCSNKQQLFKRFQCHLTALVFMIKKSLHPVLHPFCALTMWTLTVLIVLALLHCVASRNPSENPDLFEGDMMLTRNQLKEINAGAAANSEFAAFKTRPWPLPIYYEIDPGLSKHSFAVKAIKDAVRHYEEKTCLRFQEKKGENETLYFYRGKGCWSYVGYIPDRMGPISLGYGCWRKGIVIHEMAHALGFFHEQSRPDRDDYVTILWDNIPKCNEINGDADGQLVAYTFFIDFRNQFKKYTLKHIDSLNVPYDYLSIMHYNRHQFGGDKPTIETKDPAFRYKIGQRNGLSDKDILQFGIMYNCPGFTRPPVTVAPSQQSTTRASSRKSTTVGSTLQPTTKATRKTTTTKITRSSTVTNEPSTNVPTPTVYFRQLLVCENRTRSFSCSFGSEVRVEYAMYGRQIGMYCRWGPVKSTSCKVPDALTRVKKLCEGKQYCKMAANNSFFGYDPCPGTFKYLEVRMGCVKKT